MAVQKMCGSRVLMLRRRHLLVNEWRRRPERVDPEPGPGTGICRSGRTRHFNSGSTRSLPVCR